MANARKKILCIEDDRETAGLIAEELVDRGFDVSVAHGGQEGLIAIMRSTPDLVLGDVSMPSVTGFEVLDRLNEIAPRLGRIPFHAREVEVLTWVSRGNKSYEIARKPRLSKRTVDFHIDNARTKCARRRAPRPPSKRWQAA